MIHLPDLTALRPIERFAVDLLVDQARLVPVRLESPAVVSLSVLDGAPADVPLASVAAAVQLEVSDGHVGIPRSLLRTVASVASAEVEQRSNATDRFGRVPGEVNAMRRAGLEHQPIVSLLAVALRSAVERAAARRPLALLQPWPDGARWAAAVSHDLDVVQWWPVFTMLRVAELVRKREWRRLRDVLGALPSALVHNPVASGLDRLIALERRAGVRPTWFVMCGVPSLRSFLRGDVTYDPESALVERTLGALREARHEIGLHGSFATMQDADAFSAQRAQLARLAGQDVHGVRQHFLRMRPGATHRAMEAAGFTYDATFGFPDGNGFRLGVADVVPSWDAARDRTGSIDLVPLVWMDRALSKYRGIEDPQVLIADAVELARACAAVNGLWVGLWHPNLTRPLGYPGSEEAFHSLLAQLGEMQPYVAPIGELVAWRRIRREARALTVDQTGRPVWDGPPGGMGPPLEDRAGRAVEWA